MWLLLPLASLHTEHLHCRLTAASIQTVSQPGAFVLIVFKSAQAKPVVHSHQRVCLLWFSTASFAVGSCWGSECGSKNRGTCLCCSFHPCHTRSLKLRYKLNWVALSLLVAKRKVNSSPVRSGGKCFTACLSNKYSQRRSEWGNTPGLKCNFTSKIQAEIPGNAASLWLCATCYFPATPFSSLPTQQTQTRFGFARTFCLFFSARRSGEHAFAPSWGPPGLGSAKSWLRLIQISCKSRSLSKGSAKCRAGRLCDLGVSNWDLGGLNWGWICPALLSLCSCSWCWPEGEEAPERVPCVQGV